MIADAVVTDLPVPDDEDRPVEIGHGTVKGDRDVMGREPEAAFEQIVSFHLFKPVGSLWHLLSHDDHP